MRNFIGVIFAAGALAPALVAQGTAPGWYVETRVTTVSKGGSGNATTRTHVTRAWTSATCSRTEGESYRGDSTAYSLAFATPRRFLNVLPRDRAIYVVNAADAKTMVAAASKTLGQMPAFDPPKLIGDGGMMLGHRTRKHELRTTTRSVSGGVEVARAPTVTTYWVAEDSADPLVAAYRATLPSRGAGERVATSAGMVLRSETRSQWLRDVTQVTTREVTVWRREQVPAARCGVPSGYRTIDLAADLRAKQAATAELQRLLQSSKPADRARARVLGDSLFRDIQRAMPPSRSLRDDPRAVVIDGAGKRKP
ncbi:MAG: hypothetical protein ACYC3L_11970 [Gemmatimonadaceae bacterium]